MDITPVQQAIAARDEPRQMLRDKQQARPADDGFQDAMMQVSVPNVPQSRIAMLYEVQRLAQGPVSERAGGRHFQAAVAYDVTAARRSIDMQTTLIPSTRV